MSLKFNGHTITSLELEYPSEGVWVASADFWEDDFPTVGVRGDLTIDEVTLAGIVVSFGSNGELVRVRIVGGSGTMHLDCDRAKNIQNPTGKDVVSAIFQGSDDSVRSIPSEIVSWKAPQWEIIKGFSRGKQLSRFLSLFSGYSWRIGLDGIIDITSSPSTFNPDDAWILVEGGPDGSLTYEVTELSSLPLPSFVIDGTEISEVMIRANHHSIFVTLLINSVIDVLGFNWEDNKDFLQQTFLATVESQNNDGTLNIVVDNGKIRGTGIKAVKPIYSANQRATSIPSNTRVIASFSSSDPSKIYIQGFFVDDLNSAINIFGSESSAQFVALSNLVKTELDNIKTTLDTMKSTFDAHTHVLTLSTGTGTAAPSVTTFPVPTTPSSVAATKLKTE